ncbi:MAG: flagellar biosynthesis protein FlhF, partial [Lachnospiraceae bacterium]|nr:flagellar biosynthesis protein FlhF [Lachnospiraceae bacterium]
MIIKKFQANTETEAIMLAKDDLGKDAIVMNIKTIKPKGLFKIFRRTKVEVTAAIDEVSKKESSQEKPESKSSTQFNAQIDEKLHPERTKTEETKEAKEAKELEEKLNNLAMLLEQQIESQKKEGKKSEETSSAKAVEETIDKEADKSASDSEAEDSTSAKEEGASLKDKSIDLIMEQMTNNEVTYNYAKQIMDEITSSGSIRTLDEMLSLVYQKIVLKLGQTKPISFDDGDKRPKVIFFVGPTGVGKTTTIAKLSSKLILE